MVEEAKWLGLITPFNFGKPTQREAWSITVLALTASGLFWCVALYDTIVDFSPLIIATLLETFIDTASSIIVLLRVSGKDALEANVGNLLLEARADVAVSLSMMCSALIFSGFAIQSLSKGSHTEVTEITFEVLLSFPSAVFYLLMGVAQMFIGVSLPPVINHHRHLLPAPLPAAAVAAAATAAAAAAAAADAADAAAVRASRSCHSPRVPRPLRHPWLTVSVRSTLCVGSPSQWNLGMRSVTQDGVFNLLSAGVSLVALLGSLINLLTEQMSEKLAPNFNMTQYALFRRACQEGTEEIYMGSEDLLPYPMACFGMNVIPPLVYEMHYPQAWVENVLTLLIGLMLFSVGMRELFYSSRVLGFQWWTGRFWCASASRESLAGVVGDLSHYADTPTATAGQKVPLPTESTPLKT